ncbi:MAG: PAS domain S-box protein [Anaerolineae bacterium]|nr:PAS domain S-box protein [Anaerolineae bacterium]
MDKAQILVVEDESVVALDLKKKLTRLGYGVPALAASGVEAIVQSARLRPDLVLMDIRLQSAMDGIEAAEYIRTHLHLPVIYLTAYADETTLQRAKISEPYGYLLKPLAERELQISIEVALYRHHLEQKLEQSEQWLSAVLDSIGEAIIATDEEGRIKFMNPIAEILTGWSQVESLGRNLSEVFNPVVEQGSPHGENSARQVIGNETVSELRPPIRLMTKGGPGIYIEESLAPIRTGQGQISGTVLAFRDISERQRLTKALHEKQEIYRSLYENNYSIMLLIDPVTGAIIDANQAACTFYGYSKEEIIQKKMAEISVLSKEQILDDIVRAKIENRKYLYMQHRLASGEIRDVEVYRGPIEVQGKQLMYSIVHDITDRRRIEVVLARNHELYSALSRIQARFIQEADAGIRFEEMLRVLLELTRSEWGFLGEVLYTADGQPYLRPHAVCNVFCKEQPAHAPAPPSLDGTEFHALRTLFGAVLTSGDPIISNVPAQDSGQGWVAAGHSHLQAFMGLPFHHGDQMIGMVGLVNRPGGYDQALADWLEPVLSTCTSLIIADRHERHRRQAEEEIRRRNQELMLLNQVIAASVSSMEASEILKTTCQALGQALDVPVVTATLFNPDKTTATVMAEYLVEGQPSLLGRDIPIHNQFLFQHLLTQPTSLIIDNLAYEPALAPTHLAGCWFDTGSLLMLPLLAHGEVLGSLNLESPELYRFSTTETNLAWSVADQVASALARMQLDKEHRQLSAAIEQTAESVVITDTNGAIIYVNPAFEQITGYSRAEVTGQNPRLLKSNKHSTDFYQELWATISSGLVWQGRFTNKKKDGALFVEDATITPVRDKRGQIVNYVGVRRDITREQQLEEQYRQAQKMEAIGLLAGGIAHDFNNILTVINGYTELVRSQLPPDNPMQEPMNTILQSGKRAANLVRQLLAFSRSQIIQPRVLELNTLVLELNKMLRRVISENIRIETNLAQNLWSIKADPHQIEQIILNLAVNAQDAMPQGGQLTLETANVALTTADVANYSEIEPGEYVLLTVQDTGLGMSEEIKARIFEPFFTTKEVGQGTGLGLATVYGIVKQNKGHIWVNSAENQGASFKVYLPRAAAATTSSSEVASSETLPRGRETILLVEDENPVREFIALVLREQGYTVIEAANGQEALQLAQAYSREIHLLLTDMVMPGINGLVLAQSLLKTHPHLKTLIMSGYSTQLNTYHGTSPDNPPFIQKPFSQEALLGKIRDRFNQNGYQTR